MSFEEWEAASRGMGGGKEDGDVGIDDSIHAVLQASSMMIEKRLMQLTEWVLRGPLKLKSPFQLSSNCSHTWLPEQRSPYSPHLDVQAASPELQGAGLLSCCACLKVWAYTLIFTMSTCCACPWEVQQPSLQRPMEKCSQDLLSRGHKGQPLH